jgi:peptidoglycan/xylan/chitin deacetylase (PgdA/CDA1 family)
MSRRENSKVVERRSQPHDGSAPPDERTLVLPNARTIVKSSIRILKVMIAASYWMYDCLHSGLFRLSGRRSTSSFVVLNYHSVKRHERERFARQMDRLRRIGRPVCADFEGPSGNRARYIAVTFDDAYHSVLEHALPILRERQIPATVFVPTQDLGSRAGWITDVQHRNADERLLTKDELRYLRKCGWLIGSHSATHRPLATLTPRQAFVELMKSRRVLEDILEEKVELFAFPYGSMNLDVLRLVRRAGYTRSFLNIPVGDDSDGAFLVGRVEISPTDWLLEHALKMRGAYRWLPAAIAAKRRVRDMLRVLKADSSGPPGKPVDTSLRRKRFVNGSVIGSL